MWGIKCRYLNFLNKFLKYVLPSEINKILISALMAAELLKQVWISTYKSYFIN